MKKVFAPLITLFKIDNKKTFYVVLMFISAAIRNIAILLPPIATSGIIMMITNNNFNGIFSYVIMYMVFYFVYFTTYQVNYYSYGVLADYYHIEIQKLLFNKVATNDEIFSSVSKGKIIETCSQDIRYLVDVVDASVKLVMGILQLIIILVIFMYYNAIIASLVLILDLVYLKLMSNNSKKVSKYYEGTRKYEDKIIDTFTQTLSNLRQVKSLNMMPNLDKNIDKSRNKWRIEYKGKNNSLIRRYCQIPYIVYISKIGLYILLAYLVINNYMTLDKLVLLISYFEMTITYTDSALENLLNLNNYNVRMNRIKQVLDLTEKSELDFGEVDNDYINGTVEFKDVTYKIKNKLILDNVSFKIYPNEINTIVGHSGSGKSTIINLLYRLHRVNKGEILIDNESIYNYSKSVYSHNVSGVYQRPFVFDMSIKENLSLVDSNTKNQIEACKRVGIHDLIMSLPNRYNTILKEDENLLTEGEKQLLVIARALLSKAEILLFDEITSNMNLNTTEKISEILKDLKTDHTIIMVTHKPEMMKLSDRVIVIDKGKIVAKGTQEKVLEKSKLYNELINRTFASVSVLQDESI